MKNKFDYLNDVRVDFSKYENIELSEKEKTDMKKALKEKTNKKISLKKCAVIAACAASLAIVAQTSFAQDFVANVIKSISTGHNTFITEELPQPVSVPVPKELEGQIFDKDGNMLTEMTADMDRIYDKDGNEVRISAKYSDGNEEITLERVKGADEIPESDESFVVYTSLDEVKAVLNFTPKTPQYIPEGYRLLYAQAVRSESGISGDYVFLSYSNGKNDFIIHERIINNETKFESGGNFDEGEINGHAAAIADDEVNWEEDGISVSILGRRAVKGDELIKIAQSVR